jgi:hypothetical protein
MLHAASFVCCHFCLFDYYNLSDKQRIPLVTTSNPKSPPPQYTKPPAVGSLSHLLALHDGAHRLVHGVILELVPGLQRSRWDHLLTFQNLKKHQQRQHVTYRLLEFVNILRLYYSLLCVVYFIVRSMTSLRK